MSCDLSSMDSLLAEVLKESSGGMEMTLTMDEFSLSCDIKGYDTVDAINLPAEAKGRMSWQFPDDLDLNLGGLGDLDDAGGTDTPDTDTDDEEEIPVDANGNYYFSDYDGNICTLAPIDGLEIRYASDSFLGFEYKGMSGSLMLYPYTTSEEYLEDFRDLSYFETDSSDSELIPGEPETKNLGGKELNYCMNTYKFEDIPCKDYTYWMTISDEMLLVMEMDEMLFEGDTSVVNDETVGELWAAITPPTLPYTENKKTVFCALFFYRTAENHFFIPSLIIPIQPFIQRGAVPAAPVKLLHQLVPRGTASFTSVPPRTLPAAFIPSASHHHSGNKIFLSSQLQNLPEAAAPFSSPGRSEGGSIAENPSYSDIPSPAPSPEKRSNLFSQTKIRPQMSNGICAKRIFSPPLHQRPIQLRFNIRMAHLSLLFISRDIRMTAGVQSKVTEKSQQIVLRLRIILPAQQVFSSLLKRKEEPVPRGLGARWPQFYC